jgi:hypothetical protein
MASTWVLLTLTVTLLGLAVGAVVTPSSDTDGMALADLAAELRVLRGEVAALRASHGECSTLCMHANVDCIYACACGLVPAWLAGHALSARTCAAHAHTCCARCLTPMFCGSPLRAVRVHTGARVSCMMLCTIELHVRANQSSPPKL